MTNRYSDPASQYLDPAGTPYVGGKLYFLVTGTSTPADTYNDPSLAAPYANTNPIILDAAGRLPDDCFLDPSVTYRVILKDADDVTIWTRDPVVDPAANVTAAFRVYAGDPNGLVAGSAGSVGGSSASVIYDIVTNAIWVCTTTGTATTAVWTQMGATLTGAVTMSSVVSPSSLAADQNDYEPASFSTAAHIRQNCSADVLISGLAAGTSGRILEWTNISTTNTQTFLAENTSSTAANRFAIPGSFTLDCGQSIWMWYDGISARWRMIGTTPNIMLGDPGGRLTISSGEPVITSDVTAQTTLYYTPYRHNFAKLYNGSTWYPVQFSELSQTLADTTKSPAASLANKVYDVFLWNDSGTLRISRGPAWSSATARGTGAGTTEIERIDGIYLNKVDITNGPAANRGLYLGTITTDGSNKLNVMLAPAAAAGGSDNRVDVWNAFSRVPVASTSKESANSWTYTIATYRSMNNSDSNRITFAIGLNEDAIQAKVLASGSNGGSNNIYAGIGLNSTSTPSGLGGPQAGWSGTTYNPVIATYVGLPGIGRRYVQALEASDAVNTTTWYGDNGASMFNTGIEAHWLY